jgi:Helix-turn-helix domain
MIESFAGFLNAEQAAEFLGGLNARTVTRWSREGYLPSYPIGEGKRRLWRYLKADLVAWMLGRRHGNPTAPDLHSAEMYTPDSHRCSDRGLIQ